jgi:hypothetical protein
MAGEEFRPGSVFLVAADGSARQVADDTAPSSGRPAAFESGDWSGDTGHLAGGVFGVPVGLRDDHACP